MVVTTEWYPTEKQFIVDYLLNRNKDKDICKENCIDSSASLRLLEINIPTPIIIPLPDEPKYFTEYLQRIHRHINKIHATNYWVNYVHGLVNEIQRITYTRVGSESGGFKKEPTDEEVEDMINLEVRERFPANKALSEENFRIKLVRNVDDPTKYQQVRVRRVCSETTKDKQKQVPTSSRLKSSRSCTDSMKSNKTSNVEAVSGKMRSSESTRKPLALPVRSSQLNKTPPVSKSVLRIPPGNRTIKSVRFVTTS